MKPCFDYALNHCSRYPKTERDLRNFLLRKGYDEEEVNETMERLKKLQFVNDQVYIELYIQSEVVRKGRPLFLIQQKLFAKGADRGLIKEISHELEEEIIEGMSKAIGKQYENLLSRSVEQEKIIKKLVQKGYPYELVRKVISIE